MEILYGRPGHDDVGGRVAPPRRRRAAGAEIRAGRPGRPTL